MSGSLVLAIECAFGPLSAAVARDGRVLAAEEGRTDLRAAEHLPGLVQTVLAKAGVSVAQLDRIAVTLGPGGFTSLRSGLAFAKGLAFAANVPLLGYTTLEALALTVPSTRVPVTAVVDAKWDEVFFQVFGPDQTPQCDPRAVAIVDLASHLPRETFAVCGSGAAFVMAIAADRAKMVPIVAPSAAALATAASWADPAAHPSQAVYLRPADARPMATS